LAILIMAITSSAFAFDPNTTVDISATPSTVPIGGTVNLEVSETNTGDVPLFVVYVDVFYEAEIVTLEFPPDLDSGNGDDVLDPCEVWTWNTGQLEGIPVIGPTVFTAIGTGLDPHHGYGVVTFPDYPDELDEALVAVADDPNIVIEMTVDNPNPCYGDTIYYTITIANTGYWPLENVLVTNTLFGVDPLPGFPPVLTPGELAIEVFPYVVQADDPCCPQVSTAHVYSDPEGPSEIPVNDEASVEICPEQCGGEGCPPGFWKNNGDKHGASAWCDLFSPSMHISDFLFLNEPLVIRGKGRSTITDPTLLQALGANGGGVNAMIRHGVAAMLNAGSECVNYPKDNPLEIIMMIEDALNGVGAYTVSELHYTFAFWNEAGCPVNQHGECVGVEEEIDE